jgi:hypothetical protein
VNAKKCAVFIIKNHCELLEDMDLRIFSLLPNIIVFKIVIINNAGCIVLQIDSIKGCSSCL